MWNYEGMWKSPVEMSYNLVYNFWHSFCLLQSSVFMVHFLNVFWHGNGTFPEGSSWMKLFHSLKSFICYIANILVWKYIFTLVFVKIKIFHLCHTRVVRVTLLSHSCLICIIPVSLLLQSRHLCCTHVSRFALVSGTRVVKWTISSEFKVYATKNKNIHVFAKSWSSGLC